jgi:hypothetical protein
VKPRVVCVWEPDTISRLVMTVSVEAVDVVAGRTVTHVGAKRFKTQIAVLDPTPAVARIILGARIATARAHRLPRAVSSASLLTVLSVDDFPNIPPQATATGGITAAQIGRASRDFCSAIAAAKPVRVSVAVDMIEGQNRKSLEPFADHSYSPGGRPRDGG